MRVLLRSAPWALFGTLGVIVTSACLAQVAPPGAHVRVVPLPGGTRIEGSLVIMTDDSISVRPGMADSMFTEAMSTVRTVDVSDGLHSRGATIVKDGALGLAIGVGAVVLIGKGVCGHDATQDCNDNVVFTAIPAGAIGLLTGILIGKSQRSEHWTRVYDHSRETSLLIGPAPHGRFVIGLSVPFGSGSPAP